MRKVNQKVWLHYFGATKEFASAAELTLHLWPKEYLVLKDYKFSCMQGKDQVYIHFDELIEMAQHSLIRRLVV